MKKKRLWQSVLISMFCMVFCSSCNNESSISPALQKESSELFFKGGTENTVSPFKTTEGYLFLQWRQNEVAVASVIINSDKETIEASSLEELTNPVITNGETKLIYNEGSWFRSGEQVISFPSQKITIKWGYEFFANDQFSISLELGAPELISCTAFPKNGRYEVVLHLKQRLSSVGLIQDFSENEEYILVYDAMLL